MLLPDPDGPMIAVKRRAGKADGDAVEGADFGAAAAVDLDGGFGTGGEGGRLGPAGQLGLGRGGRTICGHALKPDELPGRTQWSAPGVSARGLLPARSLG